MRTTLPTDLEAFLDAARTRVDVVLAGWSDRVAAELGGVVGDAIRYSLGGTGKRVRPALAMAAFQELGGRGDVSEVAAAIEVVHTYSLVHDDLPCMDDDDLRRGRPTTHREFGVRAATTAGFRMVPLAARILAAGAGAVGLSEAGLGQMATELFRAAGASGMVGGQVLDLQAEGRGREISLDELRNVHARKTGALITASVVLGALAAGASEEEVAGVRRYGSEVGVAFQIADDVLDATATSRELGKTAGKDLVQQKATFASVLGLEAAREEARERVSRAIDQLGGAGVNSILLNELAHLIISRRS